MQQQILSAIDHPQALEKLYRQNNAAFKAAFNAVYPQLADNPIAAVWHERLNYESPEISWGGKNDLLFVIIGALIAGTFAKVPKWFGIKEEFFYERNMAFIVFPVLIAFFLRKNGQLRKLQMLPVLLTSISFAFINMLPDLSSSNTLMLSCIHLPLFLWSLLGLAFVGSNYKDKQTRLEYLRYNGDLLVMTALILIAGAILTGITIGLFSIINIHIETFYTEYIVVYGLSAAPLVATYITQGNSQLVSKVSPVIAKIFSPLLLITLFIYLPAIIVSGKNPYNDREFLMTFNILLIGVMALIFFSVSETFKRQENKTGALILMGLSILTLIINTIALSSIVFRIAQYGLTPNRLAVLGGNVLMLINLFLITVKVFRNLRKQSSAEEIEFAIASFLPIYAAWTIIVTFIFPFIFWFK